MGGNNMRKCCCLPIGIDCSNCTSRTTGSKYTISYTSSVCYGTYNRAGVNMNFISGGAAGTICLNQSLTNPCTWTYLEAVGTSAVGTYGVSNLPMSFFFNMSRGPLFWQIVAGLSTPGGQNIILIDFSNAIPVLTHDCTLSFSSTDSTTCGHVIDSNDIFGTSGFSVAGSIGC